MNFTVFITKRLSISEYICQDSQLTLYLLHFQNCTQPEHGSYILAFKSKAVIKRPIIVGTSVHFSNIFKYDKLIS